MLNSPKPINYFKVGGFFSYFEFKKRPSSKSQTPADLNSIEILQNNTNNSTYNGSNISSYIDSGTDNSSSIYNHSSVRKGHHSLKSVINKSKIETVYQDNNFKTKISKYASLTPSPTFKISKSDIYKQNQSNGGEIKENSNSNNKKSFFTNLKMLSKKANKESENKNNIEDLKENSVNSRKRSVTYKEIQSRKVNI